MKFIDEVDIELVNQELNFHTSDDSLVIKGGCDLFTTKPISSDRKLYKTIDKHLTQIVQDNEITKSLERDRRNSINSLFGSSPSSPTIGPRSRHGSHSSRRGSASNGTTDTSFELDLIDESPFGSLKTSTTKWTFANLVAILNTSFPDHDFSNLQPTTENFHRIDHAEDLINRFNNIMRSLGKKEEVINWIWDRIDSYMEVISKDSPTIVPNSRHNSFSNHRKNSFSEGACHIFEFRPSDQSIIEDMNYPYQTMWSYYWFIYNKKKKKVAFLYLTGINKVHYSTINSNRKTSFRSTRQRQLQNADIIGDTDMSMDDYEDEEVFIDDDEDGDIVNDDIEI